MFPYFIFNGINSLDMGISISDISPIIRAEKRTNDIVIPGRNGTLHEDLKCFENYTKDIKCTVKNKDKKHSFTDICAWLTGAGELTVSTEPDMVYKVFIKNQIPIEDVLKKFSAFLVQFDCFPFKYSYNAVYSHSDTITLTAPTTIHNKGTVYSQPIITVYGTGEITLTINGTNYGLLGVEDSITIDSEMMEVYKGTTNANNKFSAMDFPSFEVGENSISWTGNVTKVEVEPKWRWL